MVSFVRKRPRTKMRSIDFVMVSHSRKESAKITMPELRLLTMTCSRLKREIMSWVNSPMLRSLSSEGLVRLLMALTLKCLEPRMTTLDLELRFMLSKEIWMANLLISLILLDRPKLRMLVTETSLLRSLKEKTD